MTILTELLYNNAIAIHTTTTTTTYLIHQSLQVICEYNLSTLLSYHPSLSQRHSSLHLAYHNLQYEERNYHTEAPSYNNNNNTIINNDWV